MNDRIKKLREQSVNGIPFITEERARLVTEAYKKYSGTVSQPVLRALVFKHIMENKSIILVKGN